MTALTAAVEQGVAQFALHALWQVPLLAGAAWFAVRVGRPAVRIAHVVWVGTLLLCVAMPLGSTILGRKAALQAQRDAAGVSVTYDAAGYDGALPALRRETLWQRLLHRHLSRRRGLQPFSPVLSQASARTIAVVYLLVAGFFCLQLLVGWRRMRTIVQTASPRPSPVDLIARIRLQCAASGVAVPEVRLSSNIAGPALAGVVQPVLLLPATMTMESLEAEAVLAHEVAHLRRHDPAMHAVCSLLLLPLSFHPAAWWTARQIRQTREMACDADAAAALGSRAAYARALLRVAERIGAAGTEHRMLSFFSNGLFGAGLQLFTGSGAMEERMQMLMKSRPSEARGSRVVRVAACVSLGTVAVLAAGMLQVQPALAGERPAQLAKAASPVADVPVTTHEDSSDSGPRLLGGEHAREQLRQARRQLQEAEQHATNNEDRRRIATARDVAAAAETALAAASGGPRDTRVAVDLSGLKVDIPEIKMPDMEALRSQVAKQQAYFNSPEWKAQMAKQQEAMAKQQAYLSSPEWKARMEHQQQAMQKLREKMNSPEFKAEIAAAGKMDPDRIRVILLDARKQQQRALEQIRSGEIQRQIDQAAQLVARNEAPVIVPSEPADDPLKVSPAVMSANSTHKEQPVYPAEAKEQKIQGAVLLHAIISEDGKVEQLSVVNSPDKLLSDSAIDAVQKWTYKPYLLNGKPTAVDTTITVTYSLVP